MHEQHTAFLSLLRASLDEGTFVKLTLGKYRGREPGLERVHVKRVVIKGTDMLSFVYRYRTADVTKNLPLPDALRTIGELLGTTFRSGHLFTAAGDASIEFSKKGKALFRRSRGTHAAVPSTEHNREKKRRLDPAAPFLRELGVADERGEIIPSMSRKWKQMDKFLEIIGGAMESSGLAVAGNVHVVDFGSGKGYLTFAAHDYLRKALGIDARVTGVELREDLVRFCNDVAARLGLEGLRFHQGDIRNWSPERIDVMIALHACDVATDLALYKGISAGARIIMSAPCCHKEIRPQMHMPAVLEPMLKHGVHLGQEAEMVTDAMRALLLEAYGYQTQVFEFVSLEHTSKNKMILAVKEADAARRDEVLRQVKEIREFYGIGHQTLEELLRADESDQ